MSTFQAFVVIYIASLFELTLAHSVVAEYKHLDKKVMEILCKLSTLEEWETMLKTIEYYIMKLMNYGLRISQELETDKVMVNKIVNNGKPRFMNVTLNEEELKETLFIPEKKIKEFYNLRAELTRVWDAFVNIAKGMKWVKRTRKPYIVQGAFHGRRLGRKKGANKPYIPKDKEGNQLDSEEIDDKSSLYSSSSLSESEYD